MHSVPSKIWTRVAVSISYDDNHDTAHWNFEIIWADVLFVYSYMCNNSKKKKVFRHRDRIKYIKQWTGILIKHLRKYIAFSDFVSSSKILVQLTCLLDIKRRSYSNGYHPRKWTCRSEFKSWIRLLVFHILLIP